MTLQQGQNEPALEALKRSLSNQPDQTQFAFNIQAGSTHSGHYFAMMLDLADPEHPKIKMMNSLRIETEAHYIDCIKKQFCGPISDAILAVRPSINLNELEVSFNEAIQQQSNDGCLAATFLNLQAAEQKP